MAPVKEIRLLVPRKIYDKLEEIEKRLGVSKEDIVLRAIMKVLEEMG